MLKLQNIKNVKFSFYNVMSNFCQITKLSDQQIVTHFGCIWFYLIV